MNGRALLEASFRAARAAADPRVIVPPCLPSAPAGGRTLVVAVGKAAVSMAQAADRSWVRDAPFEGIALTRYGHALGEYVASREARVRVAEGGHPVPDLAGERATREIAHEVGRLQPEDLLLALVSGGGSSLLALPVPGVALADLQALTRALLASGAPVQKMNAVRKHLSAVQGGRLAAACRARIRALVISDVAGDDPTHIASGPFAPDPTTYDEALQVLADYRVAAPAAVVAVLQAGARGDLPETPKPGCALFERVAHQIIGSASAALAAAAQVFRENGVQPVVLGDTVTGESREVARVMAAIARQVKRGTPPFAPPAALISGGECTVTLEGDVAGRGGRCAEFALALALELEGEPGIEALSADTDGIDGSGDAAGARIAPDTLARARALGLDARTALAQHDSHGFFAALGELVVTGPTFTNVNDYRAVLVRPRPSPG